MKCKTQALTQTGNRVLGNPTPILPAPAEESLPRPSVETLATRRKQIGARVRALRQRHGFAQAKLGEILGIDQSHVSNIERGVRSVTVEQLTRLSKAFGMPVDQILGQDRQRPPAQPQSLRSGRLLRRLVRIEELPVAQQRAIVKILDGLLAQHSRGNGHRS